MRNSLSLSGETFSSVRCLASGLFILLRIAWMASATYAASLVVATVAGVPQIAVILLLGLVAVLYTIIGGLRAVMWTDVIQFFIFATTIVIALVMIVDKSGMSVGEIAVDYFDGRDGVFVNFELSMTIKFGSWVILIGVFLEALSAFGADQVAVQRYLAADSEKTARTGAWLNLLGMWIVNRPAADRHRLYAASITTGTRSNRSWTPIMNSTRLGGICPAAVGNGRGEPTACPTRPCRFVKLHFPRA